MTSSNNERTYTSKSSATGLKDTKASLAQQSSVSRFDDTATTIKYSLALPDNFAARTSHWRLLHFFLAFPAATSNLAAALIRATCTISSRPPEAVSQTSFGMA